MIARIRKSLDERDGGFTLVELLVVMIIIGILAAIAIPVFLNQQKKARETSAKADVSTIGKEIAAYYVDGSGPLSVTSSGSTWTLSSGSSEVTHGTLSKGNAATGDVSKILSNTSYCVQVAPTDGATWKYTQNGLDQGTC